MKAFRNTAIAACLFVLTVAAGQSFAQRNSVNLPRQGSVEAPFALEDSSDGMFSEGLKDTLWELRSERYQTWTTPMYSSEAFDNVDGNTSDNYNRKLAKGRGRLIKRSYLPKTDVLLPQVGGRVCLITWGMNPNAPELAKVDILEPVYTAPKHQGNYEPPIILDVDRFSWGPSFSARYLTQFSPKSNPDPYLFSGGVYLRLGEVCPIRIGGELGSKTEDYGRKSRFLWFAYLNASSARSSSLQKGKPGLLWQVSGGQEVNESLNAQRSHAEFGLGLTKKVGPAQVSTLFSVGKSWFMSDAAQTTAIATANFTF